MSLSQAASVSAYELRFAPLRRDVRAQSFPCDAEGHVSLDAMSDAARVCYMRARACIGYEFALPCVTCRDTLSDARDERVGSTLN